MARRVVPIRDEVELTLDGQTIAAERGEPIAFALIASDKVALSRGPKLHRPRGPYCLRGGCDGCTLRVDGEPNVLTCLVPVRGGEAVRTQNVLGSREHDVLQVSDWFFPHGLDHHHFLAGVPAASAVMQRLARHVAGLGRLPDDARPHGTSITERPDVLVVGAGPAGLTVARTLEATKRDLHVLVVDDAVTVGGSLRARHSPPGWSDHRAWGCDRVRTSTTAAGLYDRQVLLVHGDDVSRVRARAVVLATGTHDGTVSFANNDLPGIVSARAGALLAEHGIAIGERVALLGGGQGPYIDAFRSALGREVTTFELPAGDRLAARGRARLRAVETSGRGQQSADAMLVEAPGSPCFELAQQAGVAIVWAKERGGFRPVLDAKGRALPWLWCAGELAGTGADLGAIERQATEVAEDVLAALPGLILR